ncbi:MAG: PilW family protein [Pyrinomonadaceae bacterium]
MSVSDMTELRLNPSRQKSPPVCPRDGKDARSGFSLIELLIVMTMMMVLMGAAFSLMSQSLKVSTVSYELTDAQQNLRTAQEYVNRDLTTLGDGLRGIGNIHIPTAFVTNYLTSSPINPVTNGVMSLAIVTADNAGGTTPTGLLPGADRISILSADPNAPAPVSTVTYSAVVPVSLTSTGDSLRVPTASVTAANIQAGEVYFVNAGTDAAFVVIKQIVADSAAGVSQLLCGTSAGVEDYGLNRAGMVSLITANGTRAATIRRMQFVNYFVNSSGLLIRRNFGLRRTPGLTDAEFSARVLAGGTIAENVTSLQFRYVLDAPVHTLPAGVFVPQPVNQLTASAPPSSVRQIEVKVTTKTSHPLQNGSYQEVSATTRNSVRNLQFLRTLN